MESKAFLFLAAFALLVSTMVTSMEEEGLNIYENAVVSSSSSSSDHRSHGKCVPYCAKYCSKRYGKERCQRTCVPCCDIYHCVPGIYGRCRKWIHVLYYGRRIACPQ